MNLKRRTKQALGAVILAATLVVLVLGIGGLTWMKPSSVIRFASPDSPLNVIMTGENVLESTGESVTISATGAADQEIFLGVALTSDAKAFTAPIDHLLLKGFASGGAFQTQQVAAKKISADSEQVGGGLQAPARPAQSDADDLATLDIWKQATSGKGKVSLKWNLSDSRWSAVVFVKNGSGAQAVNATPTPASGENSGASESPGKNEKASDKKATASTGANKNHPANQGPKLQMSWHHEPSLAPAWALAIIGGLALAAIATYLFLSWFSEIRSRARRQDAVEKDKTRRLAAEVTGQVEATVHPRRAARMAQEQAKKSKNTRKKSRSTRASRVSETSGETEDPWMKDETSSDERQLAEVKPGETNACGTDATNPETADRAQIEKDSVSDAAVGIPGNDTAENTSEKPAAEEERGKGTPEKRLETRPPKLVRTYFGRNND